MVRIINWSFQNMGPKRPIFLSGSNLAASGISFLSLSFYLEQNGFATFGEFAFVQAVLAVFVSAQSVMFTSGFFKSQNEEKSPLILTLLIFCALLSLFFVSALSAFDLAPTLAILLAISSTFDNVLSSFALSQGVSKFTVTKSIISKVLFWPGICVFGLYADLSLNFLITVNFAVSFCVLMATYYIFSRSYPQAKFGLKFRFSETYRYLRSNLGDFPTTLTSLLQNYTSSMIIFLSSSIFGPEYGGVSAYTLRLFTLCSDINVAFRDRFVAQIFSQEQMSFSDQFSLVCRAVKAPLVLYAIVILVGYFLSRLYFPNLVEPFILFSWGALIPASHMFGSYFTYHVYQLRLNSAFMGLEIAKLCSIYVVTSLLNSLHFWFLTFAILELIILLTRIKLISKKMKT